MSLHFNPRNTAEVRIYIADLEAYNSGNLCGEWVTLPVSDEELQAILDKYSNNGQTDYAIHDSDSPFTINEYDNPFKVNEWAQSLEDINEDEAVISAILSNFSGTEEALKVLESGEYAVYWDCDDMGDVAAEYIESTGLLSDVPEDVKRYFDYDAYGSDMESEGTFIRFTTGKQRGYVEIYN